MEGFDLACFRCYVVEIFKKIVGILKTDFRENGENTYKQKVVDEKQMKSVRLLYIFSLHIR